MSKSTKPANKRKEAESEAPKASAISFNSILNMLLVRWWLGLPAAIIVATLYLLIQPKLDPTFYTESKLTFERKEKVLNIQEVVDTTTTSVVDLNIHLEQLRSTTFYDYVESSFSDKEKEIILAAYRDPLNPTALPPPLNVIIRSGLNIYDRRGANGITIGANHKDPDAAALIANRFARKYIDYNIDKAMTGTNGAIIFLKNQSEDKRIEVEAAERAMQDYRAKHNMAALGENKSVVLQKVNSLGNSLVQAQLEQTNLRTTIETIEDYLKNGRDVFELTNITSFGPINSLREEIEKLKADRVILQEKYLDEHPRMKENTLAMDGLQRRLKESIQLALAEIKTRCKVAAQHEERIRKELDQAEADARDLDRISIDYKFLEEEANNKRSAYNLINSRLNETTLVSRLENTNIKILDQAPVPGAPSTMMKKKNIFFAVVMALGAYAMITLLFGFLDTRVKSVFDIEGGLGQVMLGGIKTMRKLSETERPNIFRLGKDDALSEAYRGIFSEIEIRSQHVYPKRILITSSIPGEGKSLTASNLAAVFAAHGKKTLLVDCDFRRPTLRRYFGAPSGAGLLPWLRENSSKSTEPLDPRKLGITNIAPSFDLLPAGDAVKNPTEVIDKISSCDLFNRLSQIYDLVIIDTPPASIFPDALLLSRFCVEMIYVCRFKTVNRSVIRKVLEKFKDSEISMLGMVLNCMPGSSVLNYGYDGYGAYKSEYYKAYQTEKASPSSSSS